MRIKDTLRVLHKHGDEYAELYVSNFDQTGATQYYGYVGHGGNWVIQRWDTATNILLYAYGQDMTAYAANWDVAGAYIGALTFKTADEVF